MTQTRALAVFTFLLLIATAQAYASKRNQDLLFGELHLRIVNDTIVITYNIFAKGSPDSVWLSPLFVCGKDASPADSAGSSDFRIFPGEGSADNAGSRGILTPDSGGLRIRGEVRAPLSGRCVPRGCSVEAFGTFEDRPYVQYRWVEFGYGGVSSFSLIPPFGIGYFESAFPDGAETDGLMAGLDFCAAFDVRHIQLSGSYRFSSGSHFAAKEAIPIQFKYFFGNRDDFLPSALVAAKYSTLHFGQNSRDFERKQWGVETGVAVEGPFERFAYSYCTGLGGYHKIGLTLFALRIGSLRLGTQYEFYRYESTDMWRITGTIEGYAGGGGLGLGHGATDLTAYNDRPWWHKGLAYIGMAPSALAAGLLGLATGDL